ncbi:hypothetical protein FO519_000655 [Halicephalobus sp. NKZ332]|nr:hypothetical protein FO519_000655 [Halicephalobus sp. NKZ332]
MRVLQFGLLGAGHLPIFFGVTFTFMLGATYCFSVYRGDVDPVFPYISASGDHRPESCLFSILLNICAVTSALLIHLRYSLIVELNRSYDEKLKFVNKISFYIGLLGALGMAVVANFQETAVIVVHFTAAVTCFGGSVVYMICHAWISHRMVPLYASRRVAHWRTLFAILGTILFITAVSFGVYAAHVFHEKFPDLPTPRPWSSKANQPGYNFHVISAIAEWLLALTNMSFFLSFSREFEKIRVELRVQPLVTHLDHSPVWSSTESLPGSP